MLTLGLWKNKIVKLGRFLLVFILIATWFFSGWPSFWQNPLIPPAIEKVQALNKTNNWNFNGDASGWSSTNGSGTDTCGSSSDGLPDGSLETFAYNGNLGGQTAFEGTSPATKNTTYMGMIHQTFTAPGSGTVKAKGKFSYYASGTNWSPTASWIRLDIYDSGNTTYVGNLACVTFIDSVAWTNTGFGSDIELTGGTTYTIRATLDVNNKNVNESNTVGIDNIVVNVAPTGLSGNAVAGSTNVSLSWTASTAGSGANGLHGTTPYKVYRDTGSPVSTFLDNSATTTYTDSSTAGNTSYYYAVSDVDTASDESPLSAEVGPILTYPDVATALNFTNVEQTTLRLNWTAPVGGADSYKVYRCSGSACTPSETPIATGVTNVYYDDSSLTCNTIYRYRLKATNTSGDGVYSSIGEQTTAACGLSTAIEIKAQDYSTLVTNITFPEAPPQSIVSQPYNNVDGSGSPQTFGGAGTAKPVVTLYNGGGVVLTIWYNITTFTNSVVSTEYYLVNNKAAACDNADAINNSVTFDADTSTGATIDFGIGNEKDFYLKIGLSTQAAVSGTSTLTILGET